MSTFEDWKVGDLAVRKNRLCRIKKIHFDEYPPHVTVEMLDDNNEVGTEFSKLRHATPEEIESVDQDLINISETRSEGNPDIRNTNINRPAQTDTDDDTDASVKTEPQLKTNTKSASKIPQRKIETPTKNNSPIKNGTNIKSKMETDHNIDHNDNDDGRGNRTTNNNQKDRNNAMHNDKNTNDIDGETSQHIEVHSSPSLQKPPRVHSPKKKQNRRSHTPQRGGSLFGFDPDEWLSFF
jgi:hypothetical protein